MNFFKNYPRKKIELTTIELHYQPATYQELIQIIQQAIEANLLTPIKASGSNGKKPALYKTYRILSLIENEDELKEELMYVLHPSLQPDYYLSHLNIYEKDRQAIMKLSQFLKYDSIELEKATAINERSFQIWKQEKFLAKEGARLLKNVGLSLNDLNVYETAEPLAYFSATKTTPQKILIVENKDTFYSLRRHLLNGNPFILGQEIGTLVYGAGKKVIKAFSHFEESVEPYLLNKDNEFFYFGDLDYEGILIYESLRETFYCEPFVIAYECMLKKAHSLQLPKTKENQNRHLKDTFFGYFDEVDAMKQLLAREEYIPQEILTLADF